MSAAARRVPVLWAAWAALGAATAVSAAVLTLVIYLIGPVLPFGLVAAFAMVGLIARSPMVGVYFALLAVPLEIINFRVGYRAVSTAELIFLITGIVGAARLAAAGIGRVEAPHVAFAVLVVVMATGMFFAQDPTQVMRIVRVWAALLIVSLLVSRASPGQIRIALGCLALTGGILGVGAILTTGSQQVVGGGVLVTGRAQAGFAQPNVLGFFLLLSLPAALVLCVRGPVAQRMLMALCVASIVAGVALSLSRSSILGAGAALVVLLWLAPIRRGVAVLSMVLTLLLTFGPSKLLHNQQVQVVTTRLGTLGSSNTTAQDPRGAIYARVPRMIADHPVLGVGEGNFSAAAPAYDIVGVGGVPYDHAHNLFFTFAVETGVIGLAAFIAFVAAVVRTAARAVSRTRGTPEWTSTMAALAALVGLLVAGILDYPVRTNTVMSATMILVGVLVAGARRDTAHSSRLPGPPTLGR